MRLRSWSEARAHDPCWTAPNPTARRGVQGAANPPARQLAELAIAFVGELPRAEIVGPSLAHWLAAERAPSSSASASQAPSAPRLTGGRPCRRLGSAPPCAALILIGSECRDDRPPAAVRSNEVESWPTRQPVIASHIDRLIDPHRAVVDRCSARGDRPHDRHATARPPFGSRCGRLRLEARAHAACRSRGALPLGRRRRNRRICAWAGTSSLGRLLELDASRSM